VLARGRARLDEAVQILGEPRLTQDLRPPVGDLRQRRIQRGAQPRDERWQRRREVAVLPRPEGVPRHRHRAAEHPVLLVQVDDLGALGGRQQRRGHRDPGAVQVVTGPLPVDGRHGLLVLHEDPFP
jgi:hypothetical protein